MITARKSAWFQKLFSLYNRNLLWRCFDGVRARGLSQIKARHRDAPLIIFCNHSSSWDGLVAFHVSQMCELDSYGMMEEKHLRKYPFHRRLGAFSVVREDPEAALRSLTYAARLLRDKDRVLWIFPQGETAPNDVRPLKLYSGLARIIERTLVAYAVPIAMRYEFLDGFRPEAFLRVGAVERIVVDGNFQTKTLTAAFASRLTQTLDSLRDDIMARDFAEYEELIAVRRASVATNGRNRYQVAKSPTTVYVCQKCGHQSRKWLGKCPDCGEWNSYAEERSRPTAKEPGGGAGRGGFQLRQVKPVAYGAIESQDDARTSSGIPEFDRVLGGGIVPGSLILIGGEPGIGKCLAASTRLFDPISGTYSSILEWVNNKRPVVSLDEHSHRLSPQSTSAFHDQGVHPIVEVKTKLGRTLRCTPGHPVLTPDGWQGIGRLQPGTRIAAPRALPYFGNAAMEEHEIKLIAYVLSDGSAQGSINVTTAIPEIADDLYEVARCFKMSLRAYNKPHNRARTYRFVQPLGTRSEARKQVTNSIRGVQRQTGISWAAWSRGASRVSYSMIRGWRDGTGVPSAANLKKLADAVHVPINALAPDARCQAELATSVARFLESVNLRFTKAQNKAVPDVIFCLPRAQMALFLKVIFSCDGSVYINKHDQPGVSYSTVNKRLAEDLQHLLLRFGFTARLRTKPSTYNGLPYVAYELQMLGESVVKRFISEIGIWGRDKAKAKILSLPKSKTPSTRSDTIPTGVKFWQHFKEATVAVGDHSLKSVSARVGVTIHPGRDERPLCRATIAALANVYRTPYLQLMAQGDIYWDEIQSITPAGSERVYDISVVGSANFVANDLIVHNSTLLAQVAEQLSRKSISVLYISGEESERQIKMRGERLGMTAENLFLLAETNLENIFDEIARMTPGAIIVDSVQTVYTGKIESAPGSVSQVREVAGQFLMLAKNYGIPVFLIGHVTKEGSIAGPKTLEHIVDTVLYFEGERHYNHRIVRASKNRFGAANELGIFEMTGAGLVAVANPSELFLQERPQGVAGSVVTACMEGTRPLLVEVQALVSGSKYGTGRRMTRGVDTNRVALLIAMLEKRLGFHLIGDDVFVNVAGGLEIDEPAIDLGIVASIASSFKNAAIDAHTVVFGEVGLTGEVRGAMQASARAREAQALGFQKIIMPTSNTTGLERLLGLRVIGVRSVEDALDELF